MSGKAVASGDKKVVLGLTTQGRKPASSVSWVPNEKSPAPHRSFGDIWLPISKSSAERLLHDLHGFALPLFDEGSCLGGVRASGGGVFREGQLELTLGVLTPQVTVVVTIQDNTATVEDGDYVPKQQTLAFTPTLRVQTFKVLVNGDQKIEPTETFRVLLSDAEGATYLDASALGAINNDDMLDASSSRVAPPINVAALDRLLSQSNMDELLHA